MIVPKKIDMTGQKWGEWTVLEEVPREPGTKGSVQWKCQCSCGNIKIVPGNTLRNGTSTKCVNCKNKTKLIDMTGQITDTGIYIIEKVSTKNSSETKWRCICPVCKREDWIVKGSHLRKGVTKCKQCSALTNLSKIKEPFFKDLSGQHFGKLTVLERTKRIGKTYLWKCQCDCGNICEKEAQFLLNGNTKSCGCLNKSYGEELIENILKENNIPYIKEKIFSDLPLKRFDFYINDSYIIEFDGKQHFKKDTGYGQNLKEIHQSDLEKNKYCFIKHIPIIRIPFDQIKNICYNMLILNNDNVYILTEENESEYYNRYM